MGEFSDSLSAKQQMRNEVPHPDTLSMTKAVTDNHTSEASLAAFPFQVLTAREPPRSGGGTVGVAFSWLLLLAKQKK